MNSNACTNLIDLAQLKLGDIIVMRFTGELTVIACERGLGNSYELLLRNNRSGNINLYVFTREGCLATRYRREDMTHFYTPVKLMASQSASRASSLRRNWRF